MSSLIAWGRYVVTKSGNRLSILEKGAVYCEDGVIMEVGAHSDLKKRHPTAPEIGSADSVVLPGLVNAHQHGNGISFSQRGRQDSPLELWALRKWLPGDDDPYWDTLYACIKFIESGITTVVHSHPDRYPDGYEWRVERTLQAYRDASLRVAFALSTVDQNNLVYAPDAEFLRGLPSDLSLQLETAIRTGQPVSGERFFRALRMLWEQYGGDGEERVRILLAPVGPQWCSDELLVEIKRMADDYQTGIHIHLLESVYQKLYGQRKYGKSVVVHLADLGLLGERVSCAHGVWLTEEDARILGKTQTTVVHNPSSNLRLGSGIAPMPLLRKHGVIVAIGTDSASLNEDEDLWTEMRLAWYLHRLPGAGFDLPSAEDAFLMATESGARAALFGDLVGSLVPGKRADLILVRLPTDVGGRPVEAGALLRSLLARTTRLDVATVIVDGDLVMRDREFLRVDKGQVLDELHRRARSPVSPSAALARLSDSLAPYVKTFYQGWELPPLDPVYYPNSRT